MVLTVFSGCGKVKNNPQGNTNNASTPTAMPTPIPTAEITPTPAADPIKEQIKGMTLDEKIGQMVIVGVDGYNMNENAKKMIDNYHVGGFILLKANVDSTSQALGLINSLKSRNSKNKVPLFMSVDEEGGSITRMPDEFQKFPTNMAIGKINNMEFSYKVGNVIAQEIRSFGFNLDFAPVLDINSNPKNPVIGDRSFGTESGVVSSLGVQTMKGIQAGKIISVVKHFPGHGDTSVDSHVGLPTVNNDLNRLKSFELIPFADAINNNADGVMVAHILLPKIDSKNPASMSSTIVTGILRDYLKFTGVVFTDDMTMGAIVKNYNIGDAAVKSINAGVDVLLVCHEYANEVSIINALKKAAEDGTISESRIDESLYRILSLKQKYDLSDNTIKSVDVSYINGQINEVLKSQK